MKRHFLSPPAALVLLLGTAFAVLLYNVWSYGCGRCSLQTFLTLGPAGLALAGANLLALLALVFLRGRRRLQARRNRCRCGVSLGPGWSFCPDCGLPAPDSRPR